MRLDKLFDTVPPNSPMAFNKDFAVIIPDLGSKDESGIDSCTWYNDVNRHLYVVLHINNRKRVKTKGRIVIKYLPGYVIMKGEH